MRRPDLPQGPRLAAVGLLLLLLGVAAGLPLLALAQLDQAAERAAHHRQELATLAAMVAARPQIEARRDALAAGGDGQGDLLPGATLALAAATLQGMVAATIEGAGGQLDSLTVLPPDTIGGFRRVGLRVAFLATTQDLREITHTLESGEPALFLNNVTIRGGDGGGDDGASPVLTVGFDVLAIAAPGGGETP
jgi:hypothetical protein